MVRKILKTAWIARRALLQHKLRSFLSVLGVVCGVMAVLSMICIGEGARRKIVNQIEQLGTRNIFVKAGELTDTQRHTALANLSTGLTLADKDRIVSGCTAVSSVAALKEIAATVWNVSRELSPEILAVTANYSGLQNFRLARGRFINSLDVERKNLVCVLGSGVAAAFGAAGQIGCDIRIENSLYTIVGVISRFDRNDDATTAIPVRNFNDMIFIPMGALPAAPPSKAPDLTAGHGDLSELVVQVSDSDAVMAAAAIIERILQVRHNNIKDYQLLVPQELLNQARRTQRTFNVVLGAIAGISLLVGGIGIMNIMLATVSERTREIGIRRAVGATRPDIIVQFLAESVILTFSGGLIGVVSGIGAVAVIAAIAEWQTAVTFWAAGLPLAMSLLVGLFFGLYPAWQAAHMDPVAALRHE